MMLLDAYVKVKSSLEWGESAHLAEAIDFGDLWGFVFSPYALDDGDAVGGGYITVNKRTGDFGTYSPLLDGFDLLNKAKHIPLKQFERLTRPAVTTAKKHKRAAAVAAAS